MHRILNDEALDILFRTARERHEWLARPVSDTLLRAIWELVGLGPTGGSCDPARLVFAKSETAKSRLAPAVPLSEQDAIMTAPCAAIVACPAERDDGAAVLREGARRAAYLILAARALGLDCAPIWHFDAGLVERAVLPEGGFAAQSLCLLGYAGEVQPRQPAPRCAAAACLIL